MNTSSEALRQPDYKLKGTDGGWQITVNKLSKRDSPKQQNPGPAEIIDAQPTDLSSKLDSLEDTLRQASDAGKISISKGHQFQFGINRISKKTWQIPKALPIEIAHIIARALSCESQRSNMDELSYFARGEVRFIHEEHASEWTEHTAEFHADPPKVNYYFTGPPTTLQRVHSDPEAAKDPYAHQLDPASDFNVSSLLPWRLYRATNTWYHATPPELRSGNSGIRFFLRVTF